MKRFALAVVTCVALVTAMYAANAGKDVLSADAASTACYYVILVKDANGNAVDAKRYLGPDLAVPCVNRANADLASYRAMYPAKEGYTVTLTWLQLHPGPQPVPVQ